MGDMFSHPLPWHDAWASAAYGEEGFWRHEQPYGHFRTAAGTGALQAALIVAVLAETPEIGAVIDLGAGDGDLLAAVHRERPDLSLFGVDLRERPEHLSEAITWCRDRWDTETGSWTSGEAFVVLATLDRPTLLLAVEWLDDLPCMIATADDNSWRTVLVDADGEESPGPVAGADDADWIDAWWPDGDRVEVGRTRDRAWSAACSHLASGPGGAALMIDYGHRRGDRPAGGTLTGYRHGQQVVPTLTGRVNLTAHVAVDAVAAAGEAAGASTVELVRQRVAAERRIETPAGQDTDPLAALVRRSELHAITAPTVFGDFWWLLQRLPAGPDA